MIKHIASDDGSSLTVDGWFEQNGDYYSRLFRMNADPARVAKFVTSVQPSRYLGILRWMYQGSVLADVLCDTTDVPRKDLSSVIGMFVYDGDLVPSLAGHARHLPRAVIA